MLVIGLDGAHEEMFQKDYMPDFLKELYLEGASTTLHSVTPALTLPAWPCMCSGKNPSSLGIFGLTNLEMTEEGIELKEFNLSDIDFLWDYLGEDYECSILNVPGTYPPQELNGRMVTGMRTPSKKNQYTFPESFEEEIDRDIPNYIIEPPPPNAVDDEKYYEKLKETAKGRLRLLRKERRKNPDFQFVVFRATDIMQHIFWEDEEKKAEILSIISKGLEEIIDPQNEDVVIISDHGFKKYKRGFDVKKWLKEEGYLFQEDEHENEFLTDYGISREKLLKIFRKIGLERVVGKIPTGIRRKIPRDDKITEEDIIYNDMLDYERTKAFYVNGGIYINPKFNVEEVTDEIYEKLANLEDPETGKSPVTPKKVNSDEGPEIMVKFNESYTGKTEEGKLFSDIDESFHGSKGIFVAKGPSIDESADRDDLSIPDIAPTLLHYHGKEVMREMDGEVWKDLFKEGTRPAEKKVSYNEDLTAGLDI